MLWLWAPNVPNIFYPSRRDQKWTTADLAVHSLLTCIPNYRNLAGVRIWREEVARQCSLKSLPSRTRALRRDQKRDQIFFFVMPNWTCYFTSTIKYHTLVLSQGTQLTVLTALLNNPVLWGQHSSMIVRSIDQCRCQKCMKYFGPSRRDQNNYRKIIFFHIRTLKTIIRHPSTNNNHQQPQLRVTVLCEAYRVTRLSVIFLVKLLVFGMYLSMYSM